MKPPQASAHALSRPLARPSNRARAAPRGDEARPGRLAGAHVGPQRHHADQQHEHGRRPRARAGRRSRPRPSAARSRARRRSRARTPPTARCRAPPRPRRPSSAPRTARTRHRDHQRRRGRRLGVRRAGEQQRPRGVHHRGAQREEDGGAAQDGRGASAASAARRLRRPAAPRARPPGRTCARPRCPPPPPPPSARHRPRSPAGSRPARAARRVAEVGGRQVDQQPPSAAAPRGVDAHGEPRCGGEVELAAHRDHVDPVRVVLTDLEGVAGRGRSHSQTIVRGALPAGTLTLR